MATCRRCPAQVLWLKNEKSRQLAPIDAEPSADGNVELLPNEEYRVLGEQARFHAREEYRVLGEQARFHAREAGIALHKNHFVTCTNPPKRSA